MISPYFKIIPLKIGNIVLYYVYYNNTGSSVCDHHDGYQDINIPQLPSEFPSCFAPTPV